MKKDYIINIMLVVSLSLILIVGCTRAPGPIINIDPASINEIKSIGILEIVNTTQHQEITPIVEQNIRTNLSQLYKLVTPEKADATVECIITQYIPLQSKIVRSGRDVTYDVHGFEETKEEAKKGHGFLWGCLIDLLVPSYRVKGGEKYKYKTVTRSPTIELKLMLNREGRTIYEGCKLISTESRIPDCYTTTYENVLPDEQQNSIDFITRLAVKELIEPLK